MAGINLPAGARVVFFGAVRTDDPEHGAPMVVTSTGATVKVTPFAAYPAKGRATGGVRAQRFLKGETDLVVAWVGARPVGCTATGDPVDLPAEDPRRDGSGFAVMLGPTLLGHHLARD
jgi:DNA gyrase subunit A